MLNLNSENAEDDEESARNEHSVDDRLERGEQGLHDEAQTPRSTDDSQRAQRAQYARDAEDSHDAEYLRTRLGDDVSDGVHGRHHDQHAVDAIPPAAEYGALADIKAVRHHLDHRLEQKDQREHVVDVGEKATFLSSFVYRTEQLE